MIVCEYGPWREPEKPPFSVEELIAAAWEIMLRGHASFDEALRLLARRAPGVLAAHGLEDLLAQLIQRIEELKEKERRTWDYEGFMKRQKQDLDRLLGRLERDLGRRDLRKLADLARGQNLVPLYRLRWQGGGEAAGQALDDLLDRLSSLLPLEEFRRRERFHGQQRVDLEKARQLKEHFEALDRLQEELRQALLKGDLLDLERERIEALLGQEAADRLLARRDELLRQFREKLEATGMVEEEGGLYKLTPAAARKLSSAFLQEIFALLKADGLGKHIAAPGGEGQVESARTRPLEYGDSLAHLDLPGSLINAVVRQGTGLPIRLHPRDFEVHETIGTARTALAVLLDMSGSMARYGRFYNAKKVALALDALVRSQFPEDRVFFVGFGTYARRYAVGDIPGLSPYPVTYSGPTVRLSVDFEGSLEAAVRRGIPLYFTNTQRALQVARYLLDAEESANRHIILITDGVPTAYYLGSRLHLVYPPDEATFYETLREVKNCTRSGITINTFMLAAEWEFGYHGERRFIEQMVKINGGRLFYPDPDSLTRYVLVDYMTLKKKQMQL